MLFNPITIIRHNKKSFTMGAMMGVLFHCLLWFCGWNNYHPLDIWPIPEVESILLSLDNGIWFPYIFIFDDDNVLSMLLWTITVTWWGLLFVFLKKVLSYLKLLNRHYHLECSKNLYLPTYLYSGVIFGVLGSFLNMLFNPFFLLTIVYIVSFCSKIQIMTLSQNHYSIFVVFYLITAIFSGILYGMTGYVLAKFKVMRAMHGHK